MHSTAALLPFLFLSGQALMLDPLTFVVPVAMFHKHRIGNILSIRNLDCCFPPASLHSAQDRSHSPSPSAEVLSFLSHALIHLNISQSAPVIQSVMYNLGEQQCQHNVLSLSCTVAVCCHSIISRQLHIQNAYFLETQKLAKVQFKLCLHD